MNVCATLKSICEALTPDVVVFGDGASKEAV